MFIHKIKHVENGDPNVAASKAADAGLTYILVKILDGVWGYNQRSYYENNQLKYADDILQPWVDAFKAKGIKVYGWQWNYFTAWSLASTEAKKAKERVAKFSLDGFVINAEAHAKNKPVDTRNYVNNLAGIGVPVGLSTYRYPTLHREISYKTFLEVCDFVMPQVYWVGASNAGAQLRRSLDEWRVLTDLPIYPTGAAFTEHGWTATASEVLDFMRTAISLELDSVNFWVWKHAVNLKLWDYIAQFPWPGDDTPPPAGEAIQLTWQGVEYEGVVRPIE